MSDKVAKEVKSYSLPPSQIEWLRTRAAQESTPQKTVSASSLLERIIDEAINKSATSTNSPAETKEKKRSAAAEPLAA
jgi:hypothetical protein